MYMHANAHMQHTHACRHTQVHKYMLTHTQPATEAVENLAELLSGNNINQDEDTSTVVAYVLSEALNNPGDINNTEQFSQVNAKSVVQS